MEKNPIPQGRYLPAKKSNGFIYSAGMTPRLNGKLILEGKVTSDKEISFLQRSCSPSNKKCLDGNKEYFRRWRSLRRNN
ncbi:MAG: hypothetical protein E7K69_07230 [Peptoniphilus harei]|nr:hypothetical protein [Peptoniphilus harei]